MYKAIFADLDDTIFSFDRCSRKALSLTLHSFGLRCSEEDQENFRSIDRDLWIRQKQGELSVPEVLTLRARQFTASAGSPDLAEEFRKDFAEQLAKQAETEPDAEAFLQALSRRYRIYSASNGYLQTQLQRLEIADLRNFFTDVYVSDDIGYEKPDPRFFEECLRRSGCKPEEVLMIGDSLQADIQGAESASIDSCWYNPGNADLPSGYHPKFILRSLLQLPDLLCCRDEENIPNREN